MTNLMAGIEFLQKGGLVMYVLLLLSLFVVAIAVERTRYYRRADAGRGFARDFAACFATRDYGQAMSLAAQASGVLPQLIVTGIAQAGSIRTGTGHGTAAGSPREAVSSYLEVQSGVELSHLRHHLYSLSVIVTMAPLLGLLGTISGMISAFSVFNVQSGQAAGITGGVGEALIATATGLCVAIVALAVHAYFAQRLETVVTDMEQCFSLVETHIEPLMQASGSGAGDAA